MLHLGRVDGIWRGHARTGDFHGTLLRSCIKNPRSRESFRIYCKGVNERSRVDLTKLSRSGPIRPYLPSITSYPNNNLSIRITSQEPLISAPIFFAPLLALLKSGTVLKTVGIVGRLSLALITPLRFRGKGILKWWHGEDHPALQAPIAGSPEGETLKHHWHFRRTTIVLISLPFGLLVIALLASLERTPIWGRWRIIMMSTEEEQLLLSELLRAGSPSAPAKDEGGHLAANFDVTAPRDWLAILRDIMGEEAAGAAPGTLFGCPVVQEEEDWRVKWVTDVLRKLEDAIEKCNLSSADHFVAQFPSVDQISSSFDIPPVKIPLSVRPSMLYHLGHDGEEESTGPLLTRHGSLVVSSSLCNAFSVGFGPTLKTGNRQNQEAPGVVVVYTGLLDEILGPDPPPEFVEYRLGPFAYKKVVPRPPRTSATPEETEQLAVVMAHELSHVLLAHSLETLAVTNMYELLGTLSTDLIRMILYPLTSFLGPLFNDWFGEQIRVNSAFGLSLKASCESRKAETEADLLGLRILVAAGFDPRVALKVWGEGGIFDRAERKEAEEMAAQAEIAGGAVGEGVGWFDRQGFTRSHPLTDARCLKIKDELEMWQRGARKEAEG